MNRIKVLFFYLEPKNKEYFYSKNQELPYIYKSFITFFLLYKTYYVGFVNYGVLIVIFKDFEFLKNISKTKQLFLDLLKFIDKFKYRTDFFIKIFYGYITKDFLDKLILSSEENIKQDIFNIIRDNTDVFNLSENLNEININLSLFKSFSEGTGAHTSTKLMLNNIYKSINKLKELLLNNNKKVIIVDYGSGTGILSIAISKVIYYLLKELNIIKEINIISIDLDFYACLETKKNIYLNLNNLTKYYFKNYFICNSNLFFLRNFLNNNYCIILLANVPIRVLENLFSFSYDFFIISGIIGNFEKFKFDSFYKKLELSYELEPNFYNNWISFIGTNKNRIIY
ncbi:MAG: 50S ribosomal protein L11 methyltransferase [bacterium]|nr:50S ribosomal protein L11 methyltransferase [bacterium]